ncbi:MAG: hypothetical protein RIR18_2372 [Pseudomonadota bacterium]|jgi:hypothetical protein
MKKKTVALAVIWALSSIMVTEAIAIDVKPAAEGKTKAKETISPTWAFQPVAVSAIPQVQHKAWVRSPIDAFVLAKLEENGIAPAKDADRATYIRRATLDALGILPTPAEVKAFVSDKSPDAFEKLVDRLLASPKFGERQARRWLDLARYADSTGFQNDNTRPNNWRYRDYVINSFNQDKPYDKFIKEQIAGDELWPDSLESKIATGFIAGYPDNFNSRDLVQRHYQISTDITAEVGEVFLASTVDCARCHNHKTDKVSQKEYFQLQALFANTSFDEKADFPKDKEGKWDTAFIEKQAKYQAATKDIRDRQKAILDTVRADGEKYHKERYLTDSREAIFKPKDQWNALDRWVNWRLKSVSTENDIANYLKLTAEDKEHAQYSADKVEKWKEYQRLQNDLKKFDKQRPSGGSRWYTTALELGKDSPPTHIRFTGIHEKPLDEVQPALPALWGGDPLKIEPTANSSGRRTGLANWIASKNNPVTARVFVNRQWAQLFGTGIVPTVQDFGKAGTRPTNLPLLDYLADNFVKNGWSLKKLERELLLSSTYRQSSDYRADVAKIDPENKLLSVFPRKRLDAEELRDSLLYASGKLNETVGGPSVFPPIHKSLENAQTDFIGNRAWIVSENPEDWNRRSLYIFTRRSLPYPILQPFDPANPNIPHHKRDVTTNPLQALTLFNSDLSLDWSKALAGRIINEAGLDETKQINHLYEILLSRAPTKTEVKTLTEFLKKEVQLVADKSADGKFEVAVPTGVKPEFKVNPIKGAAFVDLVHTVANSNDFAYRF